MLVVTDGLVKLASDDELLAVLAHEAGHDHHRHPLQMAVRGQALAVVIGLLGEGGTPLRGLGQVMVSTAYSRHFEREADREAVATLRRWKRPPEAFFSILDKLERQNGGSKIPSVLLTHPSNQERRAQAEAELRSLPP
jgi:Zn-dependent protease with chaperone function